LRFERDLMEQPIGDVDDPLAIEAEQVAVERQVVTRHKFDPLVRKGSEVRASAMGPRQRAR